MEPLKFVPTGSLVDASFFHRLAQLKLEKFKLRDTSEPISAMVTSPAKITKFDTSPLVLLDYLSFDLGLNSDSLYINGLLINTNTIEEFKDFDKLAFLKSLGAELARILTLTSELPPFANMTSFRLLTYSDLKKHKFYYWFAFPTLVSSWNISSQISIDESIPVFKNEVFLAVDLFKRPIPSWKDASEYIFYDISNGSLPSALLRNYLYFLALKGVTSIQLTVVKGSTNAVKYQLILKEPIDPNAAPKATGWERNANGKLGPKLANLGALIDPHQLADQAVDLNLKLMKWRTRLLMMAKVFRQLLPCYKRRTQPPQSITR